MACWTSRPSWRCESSSIQTHPDFSGLSPLCKDLTHRSEPDRDLYMALANSNFKNVSAGELEALFTWARQLTPIEAGILPIQRLTCCHHNQITDPMGHPFGTFEFGIPLLRSGR